MGASRPNPVMKFKLSVVLFLTLMSGYASAQTLEYDVVKGDKVIGYMRSDRVISGDTVYYKVESRTKLKMLMTFNIYYIFEETYVKGKLVSGNAESKLNNATQKVSKVWRSEENYIVELDGYENKIDRDVIDFSIPELYYSEPVGRSEVFSQQFADHLVLKKDEDHVFTLYSEDGKNKHTYRDGICQEVRVSRTYATFYLKLKS